KRMLAPDIDSGHVEVWDDTRIEPGAEWHEEIQEALASARVAVLLVSANYLKSRYIVQIELPPLLEAAQGGRVTVLLIYLSPCRYEPTKIKDYQAAHDVRRPLSSLVDHERQEVWKAICEKLVKAASAEKRRVVARGDSAAPAGLPSPAPSPPALPPVR